MAHCSSSASAIRRNALRRCAACRLAGRGDRQRRAISISTIARRCCAALDRASHVLSSVPPERESGCDPVLDTLRRRACGQAWLGYLSSTGVYGDTAGRMGRRNRARPASGRRTARAAEADARMAGTRRAGVPPAGHLRAGPQRARPGARGQGAADRLARAGVQPRACRRYRQRRHRRADAATRRRAPTISPTTCPPARTR